MESMVAENLEVVRGDRAILRDLNFAIAPGEALHICGRNGAGKTSLLEVLAGLREAEGGALSGMPQAGAMHYVGVRNALSPMLSPLQNLQFWCGLNGVDANGAADALKVFAVAAYRHRPCRALSNGQRRRVALARLLLAPRAWWLLDEPLNALDHAGAELFVHFLSAHLRNGGAAAIASHQSLPSQVDRLRRLELT
jgi:heme exporter protein A